MLNVANNLKSPKNFHFFSPPIPPLDGMAGVGVGIEVQECRGAGKLVERLQWLSGSVACLSLSGRWFAY